MRYVYVDPTLGTVNDGDAIIDFATRSMIEPVLGAPAAVHNSHEEGRPAGAFDFMIVPGVTMLTDGTRPGLEDLRALKYPAYCLAGNVWCTLQRPGWLLRSRVFGIGEKPAPTLRIAAQLASPVGARDPFTYSVLRSAGIESNYTGCPTLFLPKTETMDGGYLLFSFGRGHFRKQVWAAQYLARSMPVIGVCHETADAARLRAAGLRVPLIEMRGDVELFLSYFQQARVVVTGRLHGALPSIAYDKPIFYFGSNDSRTTILADLGITIHPHERLFRALTLASTAYNRGLVERFRNRWARMLKSIVDRHRPQSGESD